MAAGCGRSTRGCLPVARDRKPARGGVRGRRQGRPRTPPRPGSRRRRGRRRRALRPGASGPAGGGGRAPTGGEPRTAIEPARVQSLEREGQLRTHDVCLLCGTCSGRSCRVPDRRLQGRLRTPPANGRSTAGVGSVPRTSVRCQGARQTNVCGTRCLTAPGEHLYASPMADVPLTDRQRQILEVIEANLRERGYPPTVREIGEAVGLTSPSTVHNHLETLKRLGYLRRDPTKPRAIEVRFDSSVRRPGRAPARAARAARRRRRRRHRRPGPGERRGGAARPGRLHGRGRAVHAARPGRLDGRGRHPRRRLRGRPPPGRGRQRRRSSSPASPARKPR